MTDKAWTPSLRTLYRCYATATHTEQQARDAFRKSTGYEAADCREHLRAWWLPLKGTENDD